MTSHIGMNDCSVNMNQVFSNAADQLSAEEIAKLEKDLQMLAIKFLSLPSDQVEADFRQDPEAKDLIDRLKVYFPILDNARDPYFYPSKKEIMDQIIEQAPSTSPIADRKNLGSGMIQCFENYYNVREKDKIDSQKKIEETNALLKDLDKLVAKFLALPKDQQEADFTSDPEAKALIDRLKTHFPALENEKTPYKYNNKNDVLSFIMQRGNDFNSVSNENMMIIQFKSDEQKQAWEIIQKMLADFLDLEKSYTKISGLHP